MGGRIYDSPLVAFEPPKRQSLINYKALVAQAKKQLASVAFSGNPDFEFLARRLGTHTAQRLSEKGARVAARTIGRSVGKVRPRKVEKVRVGASDGDGDGKVQDNTTAERPATPLTMQSLAGAPSRRRALGAEMRRRYKEARNRRVNLLAQYMKKRFGDKKPPPWEKGNLSIDQVRKLMNSREPSDQISLQRWVMSLYAHSEIEGRKHKFRTRLDSSEGIVVDRNNQEILIRGTIEAFNEKNQEWEPVGVFLRDLIMEDQPPVVFNNVLMFGEAAKMPSDFAESVKGDGFASVFNGFAFTKLRSSGFAKATTTPELDGTYVWARMGFRDASGGVAAENAMTDELVKFRNGEVSIIRTDLDAELVEYLLQKSKRQKEEQKKPQAADYIVAISNPETDPTRRSARNNQIREWFQENLPLDAASFDFSESNVPKDPRKIS
jgi:hypothetical protein